MVEVSRRRGRSCGVVVVVEVSVVVGDVDVAGIGVVPEVGVVVVDEVGVVFDDVDVACTGVVSEVVVSLS